MTKQNTGLMLSEVRGPLNNLLDNLSGEKGNYWLSALKKLLRKEKLPEPPAGDLSFVKGLNSKQNAQKNYLNWFNFLKTIPVVYHVQKCNIQDPDFDLFNIGVIPSLNSFLNKYNEEKDQKALFTLRLNGSVEFLEDGGVAEDDIFEKWVKDTYPDIHTFCKALIELGELYEKAVPVFEKINQVN